MPALVEIAPGVFEATSEQRLGGGARLPVRMTVLEADGGLVLVSPIALDDALAAEVDARGDVRAIVAPNLFHHLHLGPARARWPAARLLGPAALRDKRRDLAFDGVLGESPLGDAIDVLPVEGAPAIAEHVLLHRPSRTLVVTDLAFHVRRAPNFGGRLLLSLISGAYGRFAQSRMWRFATKDRAAAAKSARVLLERPFERVVVAHGENVEVDARAALEAACAPMLRG